MHKMIGVEVIRQPWGRPRTPVPKDTVCFLLKTNIDRNGSNLFGPYLMVDYNKRIVLDSVDKSARVADESDVLFYVPNIIDAKPMEADNATNDSAVRIVTDAEFLA